MSKAKKGKPRSKLHTVVPPYHGKTTWITNGQDNRRVQEGNVLPEMWRKGLTR